MRYRAPSCLLLVLILLTAGCAGPEPKPAPGLPPAFDDDHWRRAAQTFVKGYQQYVASAGVDAPPVRVERVLNVTDSAFSAAGVEAIFAEELSLGGIVVAKPDDPEGLRLRVEALDQSTPNRRDTMIHMKLLDARGGILVHKTHRERQEQYP